MKKLIILSTLSSLSLSSIAAWAPYTVKQGDQLGALILSKKLDMPLWGASGSVVKVFAKNQPEVKDADKIYVGQTILLPEAASDFEAQQLATTDTVKVSQAAPKKEEAKEEEQDNQEEEVYTPASLRFGTTFSLMNYDVTGSNLSSDLESEFVYGVVAQGEFPLTEELFLDLGFQYKKVKFNAPEGKTLSAAGDSFFDFSFGMIKHWNKFSLGAGFHYGQDPLTVSMTSTTLAMKSFQVFSPYIKTRYNFYKREKTSLAFEVMGLYNLQSKTDQFELESGYNGIVSLDVQRTLDKESSLSVVPFLGHQKKNLGTLTQKGTETGVKVIYNLLD